MSKDRHHRAMMCAAMLALLSWAGLASAANWTATGVGFNTTAGNASNLRMVSDGRGGFVAAWIDARNTPVEVYCQRVDSTGTPQWTANGLLVSTGFTGISALSADSDGANGIVLAWVADRPNGQKNIFVQRIDAGGAARWTANGLRVDTTTVNANQSAPAVCADGFGGAVVAWVDARGANPQVFLQRITSDSTRAWTPGGVAVVSPTTGAQTSPRVLGDGNGGAFLSWEQPAATPTVGFQHFDGAGTAGYTPAFVPGTSRAENPLMARTGASSLLVGWYLSTPGEVHATALDALGTATAGGTSRVTTNLRPVALVPRTDGGAILVYADNASISSLRLSATGALAAGPVQAFAGQTMGSTPNVAAVSDAADGAFLVWTSSSRVYVRHLLASLAADWSGRVALAAGTGAAQGSAVAVGGVDLLAAWQDDRAGGTNPTDLYAQRSSNTGVVGNYHRIFTSIATGNGIILPAEGRIYVNDGDDLAVFSEGTGGQYVDHIVVGATNFPGVANYTFHGITGDSTFTTHCSNAPIVTTVQAVANSYRAFSFPTVLPDDTPAGALANLMPYDVTRWRFGHWVASDSAYAEPGAALAHLKAGEGYWFLGLKDTTLTFTGGPTPQTLFTLPMLGRSGATGTGWTQFGSPFRFPLALSQLILQPSGRSVTAVNNTATDHVVYEWDPSTSSYLPATVLLPGHAYWLWRQSATAINLTFPFHWDPVALSAAIPGLPAGAQWALGLTASAGGRSARLTLGAGAVADAQWNPLSSRAIPSPDVQAISLVARVSGWGADDGEYQSVFHPDAEVLAWDLEARAAAGLTEAAFTFSDLPVGRQVVLSEPAAGWSRVVRAGEPVTLVLGASPRRLRLEVRASGAVTLGGTVPTALRALGPNPFRDQATLSFVLAEDGPLRWEVYDLAGRAVRSESRRLNAGEHAVVWDGRAADGRRVEPGLYLVRWQAGRQSGSARLVRVE